MYIRRILAAAMAVSLFALAACEDTRPVQEAGTVVIEGDSITWQYALHGGGADFPGASFNVGPGWTMNTCVNGMTPDCDTTPLQDVRNKVAAAKADKVVYLLGTNDSNTTWNGGWSGYDDQVWTEGILAPPGDSCVVLVLPWTETTTHDIEEARSWMIQAADTLDNVHVVDWEPYAKKPNVLDPDGVHLMHDAAGSMYITEEAHEARRAVIAEALATCD